MVDAEALIDSRLAHVTALVLGAVDVAALFAGAISPPRSGSGCST